MTTTTQPRNQRQTATMLPIEQLAAHAGNIRDDLGNLDELAQSIREHGIIQPVVVTEHPKNDGTWLILAGHRRTAAARLAGLTRVPAVVRHGAHELIDQIALMLVENLQRRDLGPIEKAEAIGALINFGMTQTEVARSLGIKVPSVNYYVTLLALDEESREQVRAGELGAVEAIAGVRKARIARRKNVGETVRGRPVQVEPRHFIKSHNLAAHVADLCDHTRRPKVGGVGCGQCWEATIRADALGGIGGGGLLRCPHERVRSTKSPCSVASAATAPCVSASRRSAKRSVSCTLEDSATATSHKPWATQAGRCSGSAKSSNCQRTSMPAAASKPTHDQ